MCLGPWFLYLVSWFLWLLPRECPLITWLWWLGVGEGLHSWVPQDCGNMKDGSLQATTLGHCTNSRLGHIRQSFCEGGLFACPGALA